MVKNDLQELLQKNGYPVPQYHLLAQKGASHTPRFTIRCVVSNNKEEVVAEELATASSKKEAEKKAAQQMLPQIEALLRVGPLTPVRPLLPYPINPCTIYIYIYKQNIDCCCVVQQHSIHIIW